MAISDFILTKNTASEWSKFTQVVYLVPDYYNINVEHEWKPSKPEDVAYYQERFDVIEVAKNDVTGKCGPVARQTMKVKICKHSLTFHKFKAMKDAKAFVKANLKALQAGEKAYQILFNS
jgi:hypothetical protein